MNINVVPLVIVLLWCFIESNQNPVRRVEITPASYPLAQQAIFGVGIRLTAFLEEDIGENFLVSPVSATVVIAQLMLGSDGEFRDQLYQLLQLPKEHSNDQLLYIGKEKNSSKAAPYATFHLQMRNLLKALEGSNLARQFTLKQKSSLFYNTKIELAEEFINNLKNYYSSDIFSLNFTTNPMESFEFMNSWASNNTNGLIKTVVPSPPSPRTVAILANAVYFYGEWETPFSDILNEVAYFNVTENKRVNITYMRGSLEQIPYAESPEGYRLISLPYKDNELGMYIIMPNDDHPYKYDMKAFIKNIKSSEILETAASATLHDVQVKIPKLKLSNTVRISKQLKKYQEYKKHDKSKITFEGQTNYVDLLESRVQEFANFTANITETDDIYLTQASSKVRVKLNDIVQQVVLTVNEKGTEAAAITASSMYYMLGSYRFIVNRPFVFFIRHYATSATLFWGSISNPSVND